MRPPAVRPSDAAPHSFYARPSVQVAPDLLGTLVVREEADRLVVGRIVETEAYGGPDDRASHARAGRTGRTEPMFGPPGHAYVYLVYGMHSCLNVVAHDDGNAGAVLIRALEPVTGVELMRARRGRAGAEPQARLAAGPARLCQGLAVDRTFDRHDLTLGVRLWIALPQDADLQDARRPGIIAGPRVGVDYAGSDWAGRPWRFAIRDHRSLSRPLRGEPLPIATIEDPR